MRALGVYIFAGGFSLGVREHFELTAHLEDGPFGAETAARNLNIPVYLGPPAEWPLDLYRGQVDFVYSNPPCAIWSVAAARPNRPRWEDDPRVGCVENSFRVFDVVRPRAWCWESVRPAFTRGRPLVDSLTERALATTSPWTGEPYAVTYLFTLGLRHGLPQPRPRFFLVAHDVDVDFEPPRDARPVTVRRAILDRPVKHGPEDRPAVRGHVLELLRRTAPGRGPRETFDKDPALQLHAARYATRNERVPLRPEFMACRLHPDRLGITTIGGCHLLHPHEDRYLSWQEFAVMTGYPRWYRFHGSLGSRYSQVSKAVTPPVGEYVARRVATGIRAGERPGYRVRFVDVSRAERVTEVYR